MGVREEVAERFPSLLALLNQPEIGGLLTRAVQESWSPGKFQSEFVASNWFRSQSEPQRRWWVMSATDPGEAKRQRNAMRASVSARAQQLGVSLNAAQLRWLSEVAVSQGQDPNGPELLRSLVSLSDWKDRGKGEIGAIRGQLQQLGGQFFSQELSHQTRDGAKNLDRYARDIAAGKDTIESVQHRMTMKAMQRFPHMKEQLESGMTPYEIVAPLRQIVADEMGYASPDVVNVAKNPAWRNLLGIRDPKSKQTRLMSEAETIRMVRRQAGWWNGPNGKAADAGMTSMLLQAFGKRRAV